MKKIFSILILILSTQVYAQTASLSDSDKRTIEIIKQTYQNINFTNDVSTNLYHCPSIDEVNTAVASIKPNEDNYFQDSQQLTWLIDLPKEVKEPKVVGFYDAEMQRDMVVCGYKMNNTDLGLGLLGIFFVAKPELNPWQFTNNNRPYCIIGPSDCTFRVWKKSVLLPG